MSGRRTLYEIYWEILVYCRSPRSFTAIINRCDLNSKTVQEYIAVLSAKGYLAKVVEDEKILYRATSKAEEYTTLFGSLYRHLFDSEPGFRL
jgi:predicted transcriptional regulator